MHYRFVLNWQEEHRTLLSNSVHTKVHCTVNIKVLGNTGTYIVPWVSVIVGTNTDISDSGQGNQIMHCFPYRYMCISYSVQDSVYHFSSLLFIHVLLCCRVYNS